MSYNGIGLQTARGSGTSGYVQTSLVLSDGVIPGNYKKRKIISKRKEEEARLKVDEANKYQARLEIEKHGKKRQIEVKCMELREELEDVEKDNVIEQRVAELRRKLIADMNGNKYDDIQKHSSELKKPYKDDALHFKSNNGKEENLGPTHINISVSSDVPVNHRDIDRASKYVPRYKSRGSDIRRTPRL